MKLAAMRYKDYVWPHNPRIYTIEYRREMAVQKIPFGSYRLQELGHTRRVMRGEGEFVGEGAYGEFKKLASVFYLAGPGTLAHPVWQTAEAYFVELGLRQEPRADYVRYTFAFWECPKDQGQRQARVQWQGTGAAEQETTGTAEHAYHQVAAGETLWGIAQSQGMTTADLIALNPQIRNPNLIVPGERVRVR